ncbi:FecR family protein [Chitinophaga caseinilytica]|uniref:FecR domain-containing protein n=1 Tax=Chitinophaga caseinilytica TaxID=2267521 RepID=A0ABZ2Z464_9BACT
MVIAPDPSKIFIVETDSMEVTVLGTTFNLKAYESGAAELSLVNGAVKAASMGKQLTLRPGQQAFLHNGTLNTRLFDVPEIAAWRDGKYYFEQIPLTEIAAILQRAYNLETVFDDQNIAAQTFTGLLNQHKPVGTFLENLQSTTAVQYYFDNSGKLHLH